MNTLKILAKDASHSETLLSGHLRNEATLLQKPVLASSDISSIFNFC